MAGHGDTNGTTPTATQQDIDAHRASYDRFMWWLKTGAIVSFVVAAVVVVIVAS